MKHKLTLSLLLLLTASAVVVLQASAVGDYDLSWATADGGGGTFSTGGSYSLGGTIGQPDAGPSMSGGAYNLLGGFWSGTVENPPEVSSITRLDPSPTNASTVRFSVVFSESVTGVDATDFGLTTSGVSGAAVSDVSGGPAATYTVTVSTGTGAGTIRLDLVDDDSIQSQTGAVPLGGAGAGNGSFSTGESYEVRCVTISGTVTGLGATDVVNVQLSYSDGGSQIAYPDSSGNYSFIVSYNWAGAVTPSLAGYIFSPYHLDYLNLTVDQPDQDYAAEAASAGNVDVYIAGTLMGTYPLAHGQTSIQTYPSLMNGPVKVLNAAGNPVFTSLMVLSGPGNSYNETMGYPVNQFTTDYWFPWYDHGYPVVLGSNVRTWILVGNPSGTATATVHIYIGGVEQANSPFTVPAGNRVTPRWIGTIGGPVHVSSDIPVFASERVFTVPDNSFSEMMGYPANQFTTEYWFPWYDSVNMNSIIKVGNTSSTLTAEVDIYIGTTKMGSYSILHDQTISQSYAGIVNGPVRVVSTNGVNIVTSQWTLSGTSNSFNETMGYPFDQFTTEYWFPWYDHGYPFVLGNNVRTWILVGNPSASATAHVNIYIDGVLQTGSPFTILPGDRVTPRWRGSIAGPVRVVSDIPVFASERVFTVPQDSFNEMMGYPADQLTSEYWFPWHDSINMGNKVYLSRP
jgi:hypothetical protein